jgi:hypothetical protein
VCKKLKQELKVKEAHAQHILAEAHGQLESSRLETQREQGARMTAEAEVSRLTELLHEAQLAESAAIRAQEVAGKEVDRAAQGQAAAEAASRRLGEELTGAREAQQEAAQGLAAAQARLQHNEEALAVAREEAEKGARSLVEVNAAHEAKVTALGQTIAAHSRAISELHGKLTASKARECTLVEGAKEDKSKLERYREELSQSEAQRDSIQRHLLEARADVEELEEQCRCHMVTVSELRVRISEQQQQMSEDERAASVLTQEQQGIVEGLRQEVDRLRRALREAQAGNEAKAAQEAKEGEQSRREAERLLQQAQRERDEAKRDAGLALIAQGQAERECNLVTLYFYQPHHRLSVTRFHMCGRRRRGPPSTLQRRRRSSPNSSTKSRPPFKW